MWRHSIPAAVTFWLALLSLPALAQTNESSSIDGGGRSRAPPGDFAPCTSSFSWVAATTWPRRSQRWRVAASYSARRCWRRGRKALGEAGGPAARRPIAGGRRAGRRPAAWGAALEAAAAKNRSAAAGFLQRHGGRGRRNEAAPQGLACRPIDGRVATARENRDGVAHRGRPHRPGNPPTAPRPPAKGEIAPVPAAIAQGPILTANPQTNRSILLTLTRPTRPG